MTTRPPTPAEADEIDEMMLVARIVRPYYAFAIAQLTVLVADGLATVAVTRGWRLLIDLAWLRSLTASQRAHVVAAHEVEHLLRRHQQRAEAVAAAPAVWNIAADAEINDEVAALLPPGCVTPALIGCADHELAEVYYAHLMDHARPMATGACDGGSGAGHPLDGEPDGGISEVAAERVRAATAADVLAAERAQPGSVPAGIVQWAQALATPVRIQWERVLGHVIASRARAATAGREDYSYSRLHHRQRAGEVLRAATIARRPRIGLIIDTSGSMAQDGPAVLGTVADLARRAGDVVAWSCDAEPHRMRGALRRVQWVGGGGTDLRPAIDEAARVCDVVVVVTDGETPWPSVCSRPLIIVIIGGGRSPTPQYAVIVRHQEIAHV